MAGYGNSEPKQTKEPTNVSASRLSLAGALRQVQMQVIRLLEEEDPASLLDPSGPLGTALAHWRKTVTAQTSAISTQRGRELENAKLELMGQVAQLQKERNDLLARNKELLAELVRVKKHEGRHKQQLLEAQFSGTGHRAEAKRLDLEVRDLRRRIRELEGGPPLTAAEAAPQSKELDATEPDVAATASPTPVSNLPAPDTQVVPSRQDRRAEAEAAFQALWKPAAGGSGPAAPEASGKAVPRATAASRRPAADRAVAQAVAASKKPAKKRVASAAKATANKKPASPRRAVTKAPARKPAVKPSRAPKAAAKQKTLAAQKPTKAAAAKQRTSTKKPATKRATAKQSSMKKRTIKKRTGKKVADKKPKAKKAAAKQPTTTGRK